MNLSISGIGIQQHCYIQDQPFLCVAQKTINILIFVERNKNYKVNRNESNNVSIKHYIESYIIEGNKR